MTMSRPPLPPPRGPHEVTAIETLWRITWVRGVTYLVLVAALLYFLITQRAPTPSRCRWGSPVS
jgi:hypothetical protein